MVTVLCIADNAGKSIPYYKPSREGFLFETYNIAMDKESNVERKYDIEAIKAEVARRKIAEKESFDIWWNKITQERRDLYSELRVFSSDYNRKEFVLMECRFLLELMNSIIGTDGRKILPVGLAIHGEHPVVYFQADGHETKLGAENFNEMTHIKPDKRHEIDIFYCDVDTSEYGVKARPAGIWKFEIESEYAQEKIKWMQKNDPTVGSGNGETTAKDDKI